MKALKVTIGGITKEDLLQQLKERHILINPIGEKLLNSDLFEVTKEAQIVDLTEITLFELGFEHGATLSEMIDGAKKFGLKVCSVDVAPFLRLTDFIQTNSHGLKTTHKTPDAAVTVVSEILNDAVEFPKGFYLRKVDGINWLRGYICDDKHIFDSQERFILAGTFKKS
ncbi:hypothetical protein [Enterococcus massiliensis]|uniref:hypothetical protein n=1 Tax=Enterococcus massiliensis TaxID=1640685 RepID=UPI00065DE406|nr:hypothetical protein [Enterococcus massiliensis]